MNESFTTRLVFVFITDGEDQGTTPLLADGLAIEVIFLSLF